MRLWHAHRVEPARVVQKQDELREAAGPVPSYPLSPASKVLELEGLLDAGAISKEEYEDTKQEILEAGFA